MKRVLLSGFEPFGGMSHNSSWDVVEQAAQTITSAEVHTVLLPVEFRRAAELLVQRIGEVEPDVVIAVGLAAGTGTLRLERVGINLRDARIPDNSGAQPVDEPIDAEGRGALFSTLRLKAAHARIVEERIPVQLSLSAGTFVCNDVLYSLLAAAANADSPTPAGFVHLPDLLAEDAPLTEDQAVRALDILIEESLSSAPDAALAAGALH